LRRSYLRGLTGNCGRARKILGHGLACIPVLTTHRENILLKQSNG